MRGVSSWFLTAAALVALLGMGWGITMAATGDHTLAPAHAHLNLIGFVAMSIFGFYYALTPRAAAGRLARVHFALTVLAVLVFAPGIAMAISGRGETLAAAGSILAILAMAIFAFTVIRHGVGRAPG